MTKKVYRKTCPRCNTPCKLRTVSTFDPDGELYGAIFVCPHCKWDDWGNIIDVNEILDFYDKEIIRSDMSE
jgi:hypothetical protein